MANLPQLREVERTRLLIRLRELPKPDQQRVVKATQRGEELPHPDEQLLQYGLLSQGRIVRPLTAAFLSVYCLWLAWIAFDEPDKTLNWVWLALIAFSAAYADLRYLDSRKLEKKLGLTKESFK